MTDEIEREAVRRHERHVNHPTHRPLSPNYELKGLRGEEALVQMFGGAVDLVPRPNGDGGKDALLRIYLDNESRIVKADVKTAEKPYNLPVEVGKCDPLTIYLLAAWFSDCGRAMLLGWEWGETLLRAPTKDFGYGVINHYIPRRHLRSLSELLNLIHKDV